MYRIHIIKTHHIIINFEFASKGMITSVFEIFPIIFIMTQFIWVKQTWFIYPTFYVIMFAIITPIAFSINILYLFIFRISSNSCCITVLFSCFLNFSLTVGSCLFYLKGPPQNTLFQSHLVLYNSLRSDLHYHGGDRLVLIWYSYNLYIFTWNLQSGHLSCSNSLMGRLLP